jgi:hypothetical protein
MKDDELLKASKEIKTSILQLKPNFDVINDISDFKPATPHGREIILATQKFTAQHKVNRVIRVVGSMLAKIQFDRTTREVNYTAINSPSFEQAESFLDGKITIEN